MKNYLNYQSSEYDCGPTTIVNAVRFLFDREQVPPELLKSISTYTLDTYNESGEVGKNGTSRMALCFLSHWLTHFGERKKFPIYSEYLVREQVKIEEGGKILQCLRNKGVAVARVWSGGVGHYVLLTEALDGEIGLFDPYESDFADEPDYIPEEHGFRIVEDQPRKLNRYVRWDIFNSEEVINFSFGEIGLREAMLVYNTDLTPRHLLVSDCSGRECEGKCREEFDKLLPASGSLL